MTTPDTRPETRAEPVGEKRRAQGCCYDCGRRYGDEYGFPDLLVPTDIWKKIGPTGSLGGLLCPSCIVRRCVLAGVECEAMWASGPFCTHHDPHWLEYRAWLQGLRDWCEDAFETGEYEQAVTQIAAAVGLRTHSPEERVWHWCLRTDHWNPWPQLACSYCGSRGPNIHTLTFGDDEPNWKPALSPEEPVGYCVAYGPTIHSVVIRSKEKALRHARRMGLGPRHVHPIGRALATQDPNAGGSE